MDVNYEHVNVLVCTLNGHQLRFACSPVTSPRWIIFEENTKRRWIVQHPANPEMAIQSLVDKVNENNRISGAESADS